jgi:hypothetical protein
MGQKARRPIWVAVRVERGFPVEVIGFRKRSSAERTESAWRSKMNPDYDETEVLPLNMATR